jgi:hypothetical protein
MAYRRSELAGLEAGGARQRAQDIPDAGLVFKAHRLSYHSTLGSRVIEKKKKLKTSSFDVFKGKSLTSLASDSTKV